MASHTHKSAAEQIPHEIIEPIFVRAAVRVGKSDPPAAGAFDPGIARSGPAAVDRQTDHDGSGVFRDFRRAVARAVVHHDALEGVARQRLCDGRTDSFGDR